MRYTSQSSSFSHGQAKKVGVLLTNLGTPQAPSKAALRDYLREFLSDPRVIELPRILWWLVLHLVVLRIRPAKSAEAYREVWTEEGSPLATITAAQAEGVRSKLEQRYGDRVVVEWAMRYGQPSIASTLDKMMKAGVTQLLVLPLYPQYSATTTASTFDALAADFTSRRWLPELRFVSGYHNNPAYIDALAASVRAHVAQHGHPDKLVFSYHGLPKRYLTQGDPYHCYCHQTTRLVAEALELDPDAYITTFQSRFGKAPWLQPYTDKTLQAMPKDGVQSVAVLCPGFSADCLETLEEIDQENRDYFIGAGGREFHYIPALNAEAEHIDVIADMCVDHIHTWMQQADQTCHGKAPDTPGKDTHYKSTHYKKVRDTMSS